MNSDERPARPQLWLDVLQGQTQRRRRLVRVPVFLIGSGPDCDMILADPAVPATHSYVFARGSAVWVRFLGVGPPLEVDGIPAPTALLRDRTRIRIADFAFEVGLERPLELPAPISNTGRAATANPVPVSSPTPLLSHATKTVAEAGRTHRIELAIA